MLSMTEGAVGFFGDEFHVSCAALDPSDSFPRVDGVFVYCGGK